MVDTTPNIWEEVQKIHLPSEESSLVETCSEKASSMINAQMEDNKKGPPGNKLLEILYDGEVLQTAQEESTAVAMQTMALVYAFKQKQARRAVRNEQNRARRQQNANSATQDINSAKALRFKGEHKANLERMASERHVFLKNLVQCWNEWSAATTGRGTTRRTEAVTPPAAAAAAAAANPLGVNTACRHLGSTTTSKVVGAGPSGRWSTRAPSPTPSEVFSGRRGGTNKRTRRSAGGGEIRPVEVKREETDNTVPHDDELGACPEPDAVVKTEDMEVPCKAEPTEAVGGTPAVVGISFPCVYSAEMTGPTVKEHLESCNREVVAAGVAGQHRVIQAGVSHEGGSAASRRQGGSAAGVASHTKHAAVASCSPAAVGRTLLSHRVSKSCLDALSNHDFELHAAFESWKEWPSRLDHLRKKTKGRQEQIIRNLEDLDREEAALGMLFLRLFGV